MTLTSRPPVASSIDEVLLQLDDIIKLSLQENSWLAAFAIIYRQTTQEIKQALINHEFQDDRRMEKLDVTFANLYISAFYDFREAQQITTPWQLAFSVKNKNLTIVQHIMLGMNAHINSDLAVAASSTVGGPDIIHLKDDFMKINSILARLVDMMQKNLGRISMGLWLLDVFGFRTDEKIINFSIARARDFAWQNAMELALSSNKNYPIRKKEIDQAVEKIGKGIISPPGHFIKGALSILRLLETHNPQKLHKLINPS